MAKYISPQTVPPMYQQKFKNTLNIITNFITIMETAICTQNVEWYVQWNKWLSKVGEMIFQFIGTCSYV